METEKMRNLWRSIKDFLQRSLYGCYGMDELSDLLWKAALGMWLVSLIPVCRWLYLAGMALLIWAMFRTFSKNHAKRQQERMKYLVYRDRVRRFFKIQKRRFLERKTHKYYRCPGCGTYVRIPKGHGHVMITCSRCKRQFEGR